MRPSFSPPPFTSYMRSLPSVLLRPRNPLFTEEPSLVINSPPLSIIFCTIGTPYPLNTSSLTPLPFFFYPTRANPSLLSDWHFALPALFRLLLSLPLSSHPQSDENAGCSASLAILHMSSARPLCFDVSVIFDYFFAEASIVLSDPYCCLPSKDKQIPLQNGPEIATPCPSNCES